MPASDKFLGGTDDLFNKQVVVSNGVLYAQFTRNLTTPDTVYDQQINLNQSKLPVLFKLLELFFRLFICLCLPSHTQSVLCFPRARGKLHWWIPMRGIRSCHTDSIIPVCWANCSSYFRNWWTKCSSYSIKPAKLCFC